MFVEACLFRPSLDCFYTAKAGKRGPKPEQIGTLDYCWIFGCLVYANSTGQSSRFRKTTESLFFETVRRGVTKRTLADDLRDLELNFSQNPWEGPPQQPFAPVNPKQPDLALLFFEHVRICLKIVPNSRQALAQRRALLKEEQPLAKVCCGGVLPTGFWKKVLNLPVVRGSETQTKRKECGISCIAITK